MNAIFTNITIATVNGRTSFVHTFAPRTPDTHLMFG